MKTFIYTKLFILLLAFAAIAQTPAPEPVLQIELENKTLELKTIDLAKLTRRDVTGRDHEDKPHKFSGYDLRAVLQLAGVEFGLRGKRLTQYVLVEAVDKYSVIFALAELDDAYTEKVVILADMQDGSPLFKETGPWQLIVPDEKKLGRWVRQVSKITVKSAISDQRAQVPDVHDIVLSDEDAARKAIIHAALNQKSDSAPGVVYIAVDGKKDPSESLLKSLHGVRSELRKASESYISGKDGSTVLDKKTKKQGALFSISKLTWKGDSEVSATSGSYEGNMAGFSCTYTAKKVNGTWKVVGAAQCVVS